jgi:hypothetical protein
MISASPFRWLLGAVLARAVGCVAPTPRPPAVSVVRHAPQIRRDTFPPGRPPPHPNYFPALELGLCASAFPCFVQIKVEYPQLGSNTVEATVTSVAVTTQLNIQLWATEGREADVMPHEETHRAISEHYYRDAEAIARRLAQSLLGRKVVLSRREPNASLRDALEPLQQEFFTAYQQETHGRCEVAQKRFDEITDHGRDPIANDVAMQRAIADEQAEWTRFALPAGSVFK